MVTVVDSSLWVDYFRARTPAAVKRQIDPIVRAPDIALCEPIVFELLRAAPPSQAHVIERYFSTIPLLPTPPTLWSDARALGRRCGAAGFLPRALDLLIAQACIFHQATFVSFDAHFQPIAAAGPLKLGLLARAGP